MSLFLDSEVHLKGGARPVASAWCAVDPILAVAASDNSLALYGEEGELYSEKIEKRSCNVASLSWHPSHLLLGIGWEDGLLQLWNLKSGSIRKDGTMHRGAVRVLEWSPDGEKLVSADITGGLSVWRTDQRGRLMHILQQRIMGPVTSVEFARLNQMQQGFPGMGGPAQSSWSFFFTGDLRVLYYADDLGNRVEVQFLPSMVTHMLFLRERSTLVALTSAAEMLKYRLWDDGRITLLSKAKINLGGTVARASASGAVRHGVHAEWANPGTVLVCAHGDRTLRFFDIVNDDTYTLGLPPVRVEEERRNATTDTFTTASFNPQKRMLAAGTSRGRVVMWRFKPPPGKSDDLFGAFALGGGLELAHAFASLGLGSLPGLFGGDPGMGFGGGGFGGGGGGGFGFEFSDPQFRPASADAWVRVAESRAPGAVDALSWGPGDALIAAQTEDACITVAETPLRRCVTDELAVSQTGAQAFVAQDLTSMADGARTEPDGASVPITVTTGLRIKGLAASGRTVVVWNGKEMEVWNLSGGAAELTAHFECPARDAAAVNATTLVVAAERELRLFSLAGALRGSVALPASEGEPLLVDARGGRVAVATSRASLRTYKLSGETRLRELSQPCSFADGNGVVMGDVRSIAVNASGELVALTSVVHAAGGMRTPDQRVHVVDMSSGDTYAHAAPTGKLPITLAWDAEEPSLLAVECRITASSEQQQQQQSPFAAFEASFGAADAKEAEAAEEKEDEGPDAPRKDVEVLTLFATRERGLQLQDSFHPTRAQGPLMGMRVPLLYCCVDDDASIHDGVSVRARPLRDFVGLGAVDAPTKRALIDFSLHLALGNLDEAHRAVRNIDSKGVWENMARMCVKSRRLDVAEVCLANMRHARGARALRKAADEEPEVRVATVAVQLGLLDDAANLLRGAGRFDKLNELFRASGQWQRALHVARTQDQVNKSGTHFAYASFLESIGDVQGAMQHYQMGGVHGEEIPRMLAKMGKLPVLERYVDGSGDGGLVRWWAQYLESEGDVDRAMAYYRRAGDTLSLVRLLCAKEDFASAADLVRQAGSEAAAFHLARQHEARGNVSEAIHFFSRANRYRHAIRLAKEAGLDSELMHMALMSGKEDMLSVAEYFEGKDKLEKAVQLYQKGGNVPRALELCFRGQLFDVLRAIADELTEDTDPRTLLRCAEFFMEHEQVDKAVHLFINAGHFEKALELAAEHRVKLTEEQAERMTLEKGDSAQTERRRQLLLQVARVAKKLGQYHLATKKFTQGGDKLRAMKSLLKSGDTERIIFFANVSRSREVYVLAANYLQSQDWHNDPEVMKAIIQFYSKARAYSSLAGFYDACAQLEIDEFRDYKKALGALNEAKKCIAKSKQEDREQRLQQLQQRVLVVDEFVRAKEEGKRSTADMLRALHQLLDNPHLEQAVRAGDVMAEMVEALVKQGDFQQAYRVMERMHARHIELAPFLDAELMERVYRETGFEPIGGGRGEGKGEDSGSDDVVDDEEESVAEVDDDDDARHGF